MLKLKCKGNTCSCTWRGETQWYKTFSQAEEDQLQLAKSCGLNWSCWTGSIQQQISDCSTLWPKRQLKVRMALAQSSMRCSLYHRQLSMLIFFFSFICKFNLTVTFTSMIGPFNCKPRNWGGNDWKCNQSNYLQTYVDKDSFIWLVIDYLWLIIHIIIIVLLFFFLASSLFFD